MTMATDAEVKTILDHPYPRVLVPDEAGGFTATIAEFPGCNAEGDTEAEALSNLKEAAELWVRAALEDKVSIPPPPTDERYSGNFVVRTTRSLHRRLIERASSEGVSLNHLASQLLTEGLTIRTPPTLHPWSAYEGTYFAIDQRMEVSMRTPTTFQSGGFVESIYPSMTRVSAPDEVDLFSPAAELALPAILEKQRRRGR